MEDKYKVRYIFVDIDGKRHRGAEIIEAEDYCDAYFKIYDMHKDKYYKFEITNLTLLINNKI